MARGFGLHCSTCPLRPSGLFRNLPSPLLKLLEEDKFPRALAAGHVLFEEGEPSLAIHCIRSGAVKVTKLGPRGEEQIIRVLRAGDVVGYRAVLAGERFGATAEALEETTVCTIPAAVLIGLLRRSPEFALDVLAKIAQELRISEDSLIDLRRKSVRQRLAGVLLLLSDSRARGHIGQRTGVIHLARRDLARLIATSPESVSRALHRFTAERSVACTRTEIRLLNPSALQRAAGGNPFQEIDLRQVAE